MVSVERIKYPRTPHLPWSEGYSSDDQFTRLLRSFQDHEIVCTEKRDGECTSLYADGYIHARSVDAASHEWQSWVKGFWQERCYLLPEGWRICGENLYATHSIYYPSLTSYFEAFSIWDGNICLSWDETLEWFKELDIVSVPVLYRGKFDQGILQSLAATLDTAVCEGYVIRWTDMFGCDEFSKAVAKFVRAGHVQTDQHWSRNWKPNTLLRSDP